MMPLLLGMWMSTLSAWVLSVPTLIMILFCMQDFDGIINATYSNNWAEYLVRPPLGQVFGPFGRLLTLILNRCRLLGLKELSLS